MDKFITFSYMMSFAGMIITVVLLTQFIKGLFITVRTKWVVLVMSAILGTLLMLFAGDFTTVKLAIESVATGLVNIVIVWFAAMKSFEVVKGH